MIIYDFETFNFNRAAPYAIGEYKLIKISGKNRE